MAEKDYIERGEAKRVMKANDWLNPAIPNIVNVILDRLHAADVVDVVHGEWIYYECVSSYDGAKSGYACSVCSAFVDEEIFDSDEFHKNYCGNCGAKMDGGKKCQ